MLEVFGPDGQSVFTRSDNLAQVAGFFTLPQPTSSTGGSVTNDLFTQGTPFFHVRADYWFRIGFNVSVSFAGNVMSWSVSRTSFYFTGTGRELAILTYGIL